MTVAEQPKKERSEIYISVDIEADGPIPGEYSMVSIGAVVTGSNTARGDVTRFDIDDPTNQFSAEFQPISDKWDAEALAISGFPREHFEQNGEDPAAVMTRFAAWVEERREFYGANAAIFVAFPLGFDWMFTYWYLIKYSETGSPFGHSRHADIKTEYAAQYNEMTANAIKRNMPKAIRSNRPHTHDPLDDAKEQGELWMNLLEGRSSIR